LASQWAEIAEFIRSQQKKEWWWKIGTVALFGQWPSFRCLNLGRFELAPKMLVEDW
jgi:hypothetical protein